MDLKGTVSKILKREVTAAEAMVFANEQFGVLTTYLREHYDRVRYPNGRTNWIETHYEVSYLLNNADNNSILTMLSTGDLWELSKEITDKFETTFKNYDWGDTDPYTGDGYHDAIATLVALYIIKVTEGR